jgi:putative two-component system response regulator
MPDARAGVPPHAGLVLVVDDMSANVRLLERLLVADGHTVLTAGDGLQALEIVAATPPDIILSDVRMPRCEGFELCERLKQDPKTRLIPVVLMTGSVEREDRIRAIEAGADDFLTKPVDEPELRARVRSLIRLKKYTDDLDSAESVILSLALTVEARDPYTQGHCERLAGYAVALGRRLGLPEEDLAALYRGGYLHDIGKIAIPDAILLKHGPLTPEEIGVMRQHPLIGDRLCGNLRALSRVRPIVRYHHERLDGSGYPEGLSGNAIPLLAQIISVVDVYDALTTERPYTVVRTPDGAYDELRLEAGRGWRDPAMVETFIDLGRAGELVPPPVVGPRLLVPPGSA